MVYNNGYTSTNCRLRHIGLNRELVYIASISSYRISRLATKINRLVREWPPGTVATQSWLRSHGVDRKLAHRYVQAGWLERVGSGAYSRAGDNVSWRGAIYALQRHAPLSAWPGGATALALHGFGQYLEFGRETLWLWCQPKYRLPSWFRHYDWAVDTRVRQSTLFTSHRFPWPLYHQENFSIVISPPERAAFEVVYEVSDGSSFEWAAELVQGLVNLRPGPMQQSFEACNSIRVKRILLFLGSYYRLPWFDRLDHSRIALGKGKRQVVKGGRLDSQFQITVPGAFASG